MNERCEFCGKYHGLDHLCPPKKLVAQHFSDRRDALKTPYPDIDDEVMNAKLEEHGLINKSDPTNYPSHYQLFPGQEAIDVIRAALTDEEFAGYCKGNALKYRLRAGEKGDTQQDIDKSNWYRDRLNAQSGHKVT